MADEPRIPEALLAEIYAHAREAFPLECCGYIAGDRVVRCTNLDASPTSFAIGGRELFDFARSFDGPAPACVLYHSHTNGRAYISATDRAQAGGYPVQQLVVGVTAEGITEAALFDEGFVELARWC
ncbi:MAG: Mov34/MPN/PAD-1 family protein [Deltaproteobacteria bacterium]|nr:Mov34/MPN/PAD-1 family protein [Deltaproteobacteria bacterium]